MSAAPLRDDEQPGVEAVDNPGRRLRIARQAKGLSQNDVASHLHLSVAIVQALEQDEHDRLPGAVFVRGYLRNYARLLGLNDDSLWNGVGGPGDSALTPAPIRAGVRPEIRSSHLAVRVMSWLITLGLLGLLGAWWLGRLDWMHGGQERTAEEEAPSTVAEDGTLVLPEPATLQLPTSTLPQAGEEPAAEQARTAPLPDAAVAQGMAQEVVNRPSLPAEPVPTPGAELQPAFERQRQAVESAPATAADTPTVPEAAAAAASSDAASRHGVVLEFVGPCWVDVRDSTRKFKLFGEMRKGDRRVLEGTPPYSVILGNSPMVRITVEGAPFDVEPYSRGNVARFTIDPANLE
jgi:cytoskeleton protein RodZ